MSVAGPERIRLGISRSAMTRHAQPPPATRLPAAALTACLLAGCGAVTDSAPGVARPNVVLIALDTLRADHLTAYGYERQTSPALARFARRGVVFERAYSQAPWTLPSFASIFTGLRPSRHGVVRERLALRAATRTLQGALRKAGYVTAGFHDGAYLSKGYGFHHHFDHYQRIQGLRDLPVVTQWLETPRERPFFLFLHTYDVHAPYGSVPEHYRGAFAADGGHGRLDLIDKKPLQIWRQHKKPFSAADFQRMVDLYDGEIRFVDDRLASLFRTLDDTELSEQTLVILLSDHGEEFGDHGKFEHRNGHVYRELTQVPLVFVGPGIAAARRVHEVVETVDVMPTVLELAGVAAGNVDGESLVPWLRADSPPRETEWGYALSEAHGRHRARALRTRDWALVHARRKGWKLFDLRSDPQEKHDVKDAHPHVVARLRPILAELSSKPARESASPAKPDSETLERLQALGYVP